MYPAPNQDIPHNAGAVLATAFLNTIGNQFPSSQERRADVKLDQARDLVTDEFRAFAEEGDLRIIEDKMTYAREMKVGLNARSGIRKFVQAREYHKVASEVQRHVKSISDRALDQSLFQSQPSTSSELEYTNCRVIQTAQSLYLCWLSCKTAFPSSGTKDRWVASLWNEACYRTLGEGHRNPPRQVQHKEFTCSSMKFLTDMKMKIKPVVDSSYEFETSRSPDSIGRNAGRARALLTKAAFIYRDFNNGARPRYPFRNPIIQNGVNIMWFQNKDDIGIAFHDYFSPIPFRAIAIVATVIECCIDEWSEGTYRESRWTEAHYESKYLSHLNTLRDIKTHDPYNQGGDILLQIQQDLLTAARVHAGVPPDPTPIPGRGRLSQGALNAAVYDDRPDYGQVPAV